MCFYKLKKNIYKIITSLIIIFSFNICSIAVVNKNYAPDFALFEVRTGNIIRLSRYKGKIVVLNFFTTWCYPCRKEIPFFVELYKKYKMKNVIFIGILLQHKNEYKKIIEYLNKNNVIYPVVWGTEEVSTAYGGVRVIPTTFIINVNGVILKKIVGGIKKDFLKKILDKYIKIYFIKK